VHFLVSELYRIYFQFYSDRYLRVFISHSKLKTVEKRASAELRHIKIWIP